MKGNYDHSFSNGYVEVYNYILSDVVFRTITYFLANEMTGLPPRRATFNCEE